MDFSQFILATEISMYSDASCAMTFGMGVSVRMHGCMHSGQTTILRNTNQVSNI